MRDTDRDRVTHIVARTSSGIKGLADLRGESLATGAADSPQATLIPVGLLQKNGLEPGRDVAVRRHDVLVGKHGDHVGGERDAIQEVVDGAAAASAVLDLNWQAWCADGSLPVSDLAVVATTEPFDHCVFTSARPESAAEAEWLRVLLGMDYSDPAQRDVMDMEGLKAWLPGRTSGFGALADAVARQGYFDR
jgi:ABC-type phosphate/phosphonate transport system substrate-binding protein